MKRRQGLWAGWRRWLGPLPLVLGLALLPGPRAWASDCETVAQCIRQLSFGEQPFIREKAARLLAEFGGPEALAALTKALKEDPGEYVRVYCAQALGRVGGSGVVKPLAGALAQDKRETVRQAAAAALGQVGSAEGLAPLAAAVEGDLDMEVRRQAVAAAARLKAAKVEPLLLAVLSRDGRDEVRLQAAVGLNRPGLTKAAVGPMAEALAKDGAEGVRQAVARAMAGLPADNQATDQALISALKDDPDGGVRRAAAISLGQRKKAEFFAPLVLAARSDGDLEVRVQAAWALGQVGGVEALEALRYFSEQAESPRMRRAAQDALKGQH